MNPPTPPKSRLMNGVAKWTAFYRSNPHRFVQDYLHINLHLFQIILINMMNWSTTTVFIGSRGIGKTFLSAIYCVVRCVLYPGTKICIASGTRGQANTVLEKIMLEIMPNSSELRAEIDHKESKFNGTNAQIVFKNTSYIKVVTASDSSRGNRANLLLLDEFRLISKDVIDTILKKFLTLRRMPPYRFLNKREKKEAYAREKNLTMYLTSAYHVDHWSYTKVQDTANFMLDDTRRQFVCGLPYQLSITEGLLDEELIRDEMEETDFNELKFQMEYEALWWGSGTGSFFDYKSISKNRKIKFPMLRDRVSSLLPNVPEVRIRPKEPGEVRLLSADIALMSSGKGKKNDSTAIYINQMMPTKAGRYMDNIVYAESHEGLRTEDQALEIRKLFDEYSCDYIALDCAGLGLGVYDALAGDIVDSDTGEIYPALSCINDEEMAKRCLVTGAEKVIYSIKAGTQFNSDAAFRLREGFISGRIRLLQTEYDAEVMFEEIKGFKELLPAEKILILHPYIETTLMVSEIVDLQHEEKNNRVRMFEKSGKRKDRYSSLSYNYYTAREIEADLLKRTSRSSGGKNAFIINAPNSGRRKGVNTGGRRKTGWR